MIGIFYALIYSEVLTFISVSIGLLTERWYDNDQTVEPYIGKMMAFTMIISAILTPIFGLLIDKL